MARIMPKKGIKVAVKFAKSL